jgi:ribosome-associated protein
MVNMPEQSPLPMQSDKLCDLVEDAVDELKGVDIVTIDVREATDVMDYMIVASGTSNRHVKSITDHVRERCRDEGVKPYGVEGMDTGEWVLIDFSDVIVHVMLPAMREFYDLEGLWGVPASRREEV